MMRWKQTELTCREVVEIVNDYVTDAMAAEARADFEQHLHACPWCMTYLDQLRATVSLVGASAKKPDPLPADVEQRFRSMFRVWRSA